MTKPPFQSFSPRVWRPKLQVVVVYEFYDARSILDALVRFSGTVEVKDLVENKYADLIRDSPDSLEVALREQKQNMFCAQFTLPDWFS